MEYGGVATFKETMSGKYNTVYKRYIALKL